MGERMTSILAGHPPLWVRMTATDSTTSTVYVNQARVVFVYQLSPPNTQNIKQFLYLIDSVLEPLVPVDTGAREHFVDIKAGDVLRYPNRYSLGDFSVKKIAERVASLGWDKFPEYSSYGKFTFFLPVDLAFHKLRVGTIDEDVVRAHIIPDKLLFTHPVKRRMPSVPTLQYNSTRGSLALRVMAKIFEKDGVSMVESQTVVGTKRHGRGTVEAQSVRANIPVQNGIVHLIDRPLVVMASTVWQHLDPSQPNNQRFRMFAEYVQQSPGLAAKIKDPNNVFEGTVFIPTNEAFNFLSKDKMNETISSDMDRILGLHFLDQTIQTDDIRVLNPQADSGMFSTVAAWPSNTKSRVWLWDKDGTIQVDGGGVQAEVVEANVGASNG